MMPWRRIAARRQEVSAEVAAQRYERGMREIARALDRLEREAMAEDVEAFVTALDHDLVDADDFAR